MEGSRDDSLSNSSGSGSWTLFLAIPILTALPYATFRAVMNLLHWIFGPRSYLNDSFVQNFENVGVFALLLTFVLPILATLKAKAWGARSAICVAALILGTATPIVLYSLWFNSPSGQFNKIRNDAVEFAVKAALARSDDVSWGEAYGEDFADWRRSGENLTALRWIDLCTKIAYSPPYPNSERAAEMCKERILRAKPKIISDLKREGR